MVARRHGLTPQQVFGWRREARRAHEVMRAPSAIGFVPAVVAEPTPKPIVASARRPQLPRRPDPAAGIELEISGVAVRVGSSASTAQIAAVILALKVSA